MRISCTSSAGASTASGSNTATSEAAAADYVARWVRGAEAANNLTIDWVGVWNEREYTKSYVKTLRATLDARNLSSVKVFEW